MASKTKFSDEVLAAIAQRYSAGESCHAIGKAVGSSGQTVARALAITGVTLRPDSVKPRYSESIKAEALRLYATERISAAKVALRMGLDPQTVKEWLRANGSARSMSEAASLSIAQGELRIRSKVLSWTSRKSGGVQHAASTYEIIRMAQLDEDPEVLEWDRCTDAIPYLSRNGRWRHYTPDFVVRRADGNVVEEVKPQAMLSKLDNPAKIAAAQAWYGATRTTFKVVTETDLAQAEVPEVLKGMLYLDAEERKQLRAEKQRRRRAEKARNMTETERAAARAHWALKARRARNRGCQATNYYKPPQI